MIDLNFHTIPGGKVALYKLTNASGASVILSSLGAGITSVIVPDSAGHMADVVLGYENIADYMADSPCAGKTPGRFANRISGAAFTLDGHAYHLTPNDGPNSLHGGPGGFQNRIWAHEEIPGGVVFRYRSPDGEEGFPGNLDVEVRYMWDDDCRLTIDFRASADRPTIVNLTNHAYFNLAGHDSGSCLGHELTLASSSYIQADAADIPTGRIMPVAETPMDFRESKPLGRDISADFENLRSGKGYNHYFLIDGADGVAVREAALLSDPLSGRTLRVYTDQPGLMLYTGNWLAGAPAGKQGAVYADHAGVAIECQDAPDAPNRPEFKSVVLRPGEIYSRRVAYLFGIRKPEI